MTERVKLKEEAQILLPAIVARMNNIPYPDSCMYFIIDCLLIAEEIRVALIDLLTVCLESDKYQVLYKAGEICSMISKAA